MDIKCRKAKFRPDAVVLVATIRALKMHGGLAKNELSEENLAALEAGTANLLQHLENLRGVYGLPVVVAVNRFQTDTPAEIALVQEACAQAGAQAVLTEVWAKGGAGALELADAVVALAEGKSKFSYCYPDAMPLKEKIEAVARKIYHADGVDFAPAAESQLARLEELGFSRFPVCIAKTQYSFSDNPALLGAPRGFRIAIREVKVSAGAGFVVALAGNIMTMPGLPRVPAAEGIDVDDGGRISGLF